MTELAAGAAVHLGHPGHRSSPDRSLPPGKETNSVIIICSLLTCSSVCCLVVGSPSIFACYCCFGRTVVVVVLLVLDIEGQRRVYIFYYSLSIY